MSEQEKYQPTTKEIQNGKEAMDEGEETTEENEDMRDLVGLKQQLEERFHLTKPEGEDAKIADIALMLPGGKELPFGEIINSVKSYFSEQGWAVSEESGGLAASKEGQPPLFISVNKSKLSSGEVLLVNIN